MERFGPAQADFIPVGRIIDLCLADHTGRGNILVTLFMDGPYGAYCTEGAVIIDDRIHDSLGREREGGNCVAGGTITHGDKVQSYPVKILSLTPKFSLISLH